MIRPPRLLLMSLTLLTVTRLQCLQVSDDGDVVPVDDVVRGCLI